MLTLIVDWQVTTAAGMVNQATIAFPSLSLGTKVDESLDVSESNAMVLTVSFIHLDKTISYTRADTNGSL